MRKLSRTPVPSAWAFLVQEPNAVLSREKIVDAAVELADREGLKAVSIRNLAESLKSSPMALYHHIHCKENLLKLMLDSTYREMSFEQVPQKNWRAVLTLFARQNRTCLQRHRWITALAPEDKQYGPEASRVLEWYLEALNGCGLDLMLSLQILEVLFSFVLGFVANDVYGAGSDRAGSDHSRKTLFSPDVLATGQYPRVAAFTESYENEFEDSRFERALDWVLNGIAPEFRSKPFSVSS